ncbi:MAG: PQQ-dependent sugar dehydrogenase, partial [Gemmatimonadota bacterium]
RVRAGANYGWPRVTGDETAPGLTPPVLHSGGDTWAPGDVAHRDGSLFWAGLRGASLYQARLAAGGEASSPQLVRHFRDDFGRLRAVRVGPQGDLWLATSNRDGRGDPRPGDDRIVRVDGGVF